jgi:hypothetical protein
MDKSITNLRTNRMGYIGEIRNQQWRRVSNHAIRSAFLILLAVAGLVGVLFGSGPVAQAATIIVDTSDPSINDGDGFCSLIEAMVNANDNAATYADCPAGSGADVIDLQAPGPYIITGIDNNTNGDNGLPSVTSEMVINGNGTIIRRSLLFAPQFRIFHISAGGKLVLNDLTVSRGVAAALGTNGGGIYNAGQLELNNTTVSLNQTTGGGGAIYNSGGGVLRISNSILDGNSADVGGGFRAGGNVTILDSTVSNNQAEFGGGFINTISSEVLIMNSLFSVNQAVQGGGGMFTNGMVTIIDSEIAGNMADAGGGIFKKTGTLELRRSLVNGNGALGGSGGGFLNDFGATTIVLSSIAQNRAHLNGGGLYNAQNGVLTVTDSDLSENSAEMAGGGGYNENELTLIRSTIQDNVAIGLDGGGLFNTGGSELRIDQSRLINNTAGTNNGGGIRAGGILMITYSLFMGNTANYGGGLVSTIGSTVTITGSTFDSNAAMQSGGGAFMNGTVAITGSTFHHNQASTGGGVYQQTGTLELSNSTVSGNKALAGNGGGVLSNALSATLINVTITGNNATGQGGGLRRSSGDVELRNTIVALNPSGGDCDGMINSNGHNLDSDNTCSLIAATDIPGVNPLLDLLQDNGGPTWTHALQAGSPAIDAGDDGVCAAAPVNGVDQRGGARPAGPNCDIGAYEYKALVHKNYIPILLYSP